MMSIFKKHYRWFVIFIGVVLLGLMVSAKTAQRDIEVIVSAEAGFGKEDFQDHGKDLAKGQIIDYLIEVKNNSSFGKSYSDVLVIMGTPDYMTYLPDSTFISSDDYSGAMTAVPDSADQENPLEMGQEIDDLRAGDSVFYRLSFQVNLDIVDDPEYTVIWASASTRYSATPIVSNLVETKISGEADSMLSVRVNTFPEAGSQVFPGSVIGYNYTIHNRGGKVAKGVTLVTFVPDHTSCSNGNCGAITIGDIQPNEVKTQIMEVKIKKDVGAIKEIVNQGYQLAGDDIDIKNTDKIIHPLIMSHAVNEGDFFIRTTQAPDVLLNSLDGLSARSDGYDATDTEVEISYTGDEVFTYPDMSRVGGHSPELTHCNHYYQHKNSATFYTYNSNEIRRNWCTSAYDECNPHFSTSPILIRFTVELPALSPKLVWTEDGSSVSFSKTYEIPGNPNDFMKRVSSPKILIVKGLLTSRAIFNGALGNIKVKAESNVRKDKWVYTRVENIKCGKDGQYGSYPKYRWVKHSMGTVDLFSEASSSVSVLTSTAWLKTEGGHVGTNGVIRDDQDPFHAYNQVDQGYQDINGNFRNKVVQSLSSKYTPHNKKSSKVADGLNSDFLIFNKGNSADFKSKSGGQDVISGKTFSSDNSLEFVEKGLPYDRSEFPRNYKNDLLNREYYGEVIKDSLPAHIKNHYQLKNHAIYVHNGDLHIGQQGLNDTIQFSGGRARIYVTGTVYINANLAYENLPTKSYNEVTSVRIDAENIVVKPEVTDIELMLLAREKFESGEGHQQLRILGDVIAKKAYWQRKPLREENPIEFNRPSEHIIEDYRKYVAPPPGDTQIPDETGVWRQVNPSTGEVLDAY